MRDYSLIPDELKNLPQWVCAKADSKAPMRADRLQGASSTDNTTWCDFEQAVWAVNQGYYDDIGFVFTESNGYVGVDIDCGFDTDGLLTPLGIDIIRTCASYTEESRSGRGVHIILKGGLPVSGMNNRKGVEVYKTGRYFIMTGKQTLYDKIIHNEDAVNVLMQKYFNMGVGVQTTTHKQYRKDVVYAPTYDVPLIHNISIKPIYRDVTEGCRNLSMASLAGQMHRYGYKPKDIGKELRRVNKLHVKPPLPDREIQSIVESICKYRG